MVFLQRHYKQRSNFRKIRRWLKILNVLQILQFLADIEKLFPFVKLYNVNSVTVYAYL